ncbi:hypothetical protein B0A52_08374 [Exophiala mesophila]|uniref:Zn(2)-C6 fungal-type domain-containing protein n=1 Tax=Exophiala mesophila TaxID=212818 RepID=A0A438MW28_EXOME|nr:hypothetical protein B0A52_08374 [Exophiala mesophila]
MNESREAKRVRQACLNCRRKKSRCSGEKPVCSFCARLKQECSYDDGPIHASMTSANEINLAARVALLESKLSMLDSGGSDFSMGFGNDAQPFKRRRSSPADGPTLSSKSDDSPRHQPEVNQKFSKIPPDSPYAYFRPEYFYRRLDSNEIPDYLLMAVIAVAARFSDDPFFEGRQLEIVEHYARAAWNEIFDKSFSEDYSLDVHAVQATNMLAVVDFTAGRHNLGWVKIGLTVRFAQSLQLNKEPLNDLSADEKDERRLTFWSVYLLDRLVSCGTNRPPTLSDGDCTVRLPTAAAEYNEQGSKLLPDLRALNDTSWDGNEDNIDCLAKTILMASALGRVERHTLQYDSGSETYPPWDSRSQFASIYSQLLNFEAHCDLTRVSFSTTIRRYIKPNGLPDNPAAGHFVFANVLYHLNHCLLHHPFLLKKRLEPRQTRVSPSFLREALRRSREHAYQLTVLLRIVQRHNLTLTSFYAYSTMVAGTIHKLFIHHVDEYLRKSAQQLYDYSLDFLSKGRGTWDHYPRVANALEGFAPNAASARALVTINSSQIEDPSLDILWSLLDYGWLSDPARSLSPSENQSVNAVPVSKPKNGISHDSALTTHDFDLGSDYGVDDSIMGVEESILVANDVGLDFMNFPQTLPDNWLEEPTDDVNFATGSGLPSPWTPNLTS